MNKLIIFLGKNWKTGVMGLATALITLLQVFGITHWTTEQIGATIALFVAVGLIVAKDGDKGINSEPSEDR